VAEGNKHKHKFDTFAGYRFQEPFLLAEALHPDRYPARIGQRIARDGNMDLAILGDKIIDIILLDQRYPAPQSRNDICRRGGWFNMTSEDGW
jgi:hypothetical protein